MNDDAKTPEPEEKPSHADFNSDDVPLPDHLKQAAERLRDKILFDRGAQAEESEKATPIDDDPDGFSEATKRLGRAFEERHERHGRAVRKAALANARLWILPSGATVDPDRIIGSNHTPASLDEVAKTALLLDVNAMGQGPLPMVSMIYTGDDAAALQAALHNIAEQIEAPTQPKIITDTTH